MQTFPWLLLEWLSKALTGCFRNGPFDTSRLISRAGTRTGGKDGRDQEEDEEEEAGLNTFGVPAEPGADLDGRK